MKISQLVVLSLALCCLAQYGEGYMCYFSLNSSEGLDKSKWNTMNCPTNFTYCKVEYFNDESKREPYDIMI